MMITALLAATLAALPLALGKASSKRGLIYIPSDDYPQDDKTWTETGSDLTWYYNYASKPSPAFAQSKLQFVPMLFGAPASDSYTSFLDDVRAQMKGGAKVPYVLAFNEPDGTNATGGSGVSPELAAKTWIREIQPLKSDGVALGAPAVTGGAGGFTWLEQFFDACKGQCTPDFVPVHWYGNFEGLASHLGQVRDTYKNLTIWVTEYALPDANLTESQTFANMSSHYITHYSYFGSFRSSASNVGVNAAMLTQDGKLTDIGAYYLNVPPQGNKPKGGAGHGPNLSWWTLLVGVALCMAFTRL
ncbi:MAG: hypothetical protein M4579_005785 [Chaenotheca gracillima]|nr:MAG: hypothetical protein M4579_005785 [Chaenotheca gracillima]